MEYTQPFRTLGTMLDCSRNAVPNMASLKKWIDLTAGLGFNTLLLYTEDTYEVPGEPYFGYLRGRFTQEELREADRYAAARGMTLIPCIQTLAHLNQIKRWPIYKEHFDTADILLAGDGRVYELIDRMFASIASCFSCRTVHIGMDEAHMLGRGKYLDQHGDSNRTEIMLEHLRRVCRIGEKYGFRFLMWSDMFFRLAGGGKYYVSGVTFNDEIRAMIPENVELVYWDYYHTDRADYDRMIEAHEALHPGTWFAGGLWTWTGFLPHNGYSIAATKAALMSCREHGIRNVFLTLWGDNGGECSFFSLLPSLFYASELAKGNPDEELIRRRFEERFGLPFEAFMQLDLPGTLHAAENAQCNLEKYLLYNDCLLGQLDPAVPEGCGGRFAACAERLEKLSDHPEWGYLFYPAAALCRVLEVKAELGVRTRRAYAEGKESLRALLPVYEEAETRLRAFYDAFRKQWFADNKPQGFEVQDARLGGLMRRLESCRTRLQEYCDGKTERLEELEEELLPYGDPSRTAPLKLNNWEVTVSTGVV